MKDHHERAIETRTGYQTATTTANATPTQDRKISTETAGAMRAIETLSGDGIRNSRDNCPEVANRDQRDDDGVGNACEPPPPAPPPPPPLPPSPTAIESTPEVTPESLARDLAAPGLGEELTAPPHFRWAAKLETGYYNLQLYRMTNGQRTTAQAPSPRSIKILSTWPVLPSYAMPIRWIFAGKVNRLSAGTYEWFFWPGIGSREASRFGPLVGESSFVISQGAKLSTVHTGSRNADTLSGGRWSDKLVRRRGSDRLSGGRGPDLLQGGRGHDRVFGGKGADFLVGGPGRDRLVGGPGEDHIVARDGRRDVIDCGTGEDRVIADKSDRIAANCELVWQSVPPRPGYERSKLGT